MTTKAELYEILADYEEEASKNRADLYLLRKMVDDNAKSLDFLTRENETLKARIKKSRDITNAAMVMAHYFMLEGAS